ncbi:hypothetical protein [Parasitella parasitica]|uniref:RING-type domain-containing protein n=1 Tax=Parasitella parasitica TaxID=35722 RepID=A0A0B7NGV3_9FUNG|nr:hypothetical protein [Parasitella parasitica]
MNNLQDINIIKQFLDCSICLSPLSDPITTQCGHTFCKECLIRTMTDLKTRSCPFCRHELMRIGKVNQIVSGWIDYAYNNVDSDEFTVSAMNSKQHTPIIKVSLTVAFPSQHCLFHINVTNDKSLLLQEMTTRPHQKHYAICVFTKDSNPNEFYDYGIMMQVNHVEYSPDIRHSVVQAFGLFRLKISNLTIDQEGFYVGDITRFDDINHNNDSDFDLQVQTKRWTMPTLSSATTTSISMSRPISTSSSTVTRNNNKQVARPRPCSMRLSSSAPNHIPSFNNIPGSMNRRTWASTMHFGVIKPPSPPPQSPGTTTAQHYFKPPKKSSLKTLNTVPNINFLFNQEIHPRLVQYLSSTSNHAWIMQYDWHLQQSDQETIVWWIANVLPLDQQEKICLLGISTLRERLMAIYHWFDRLQPPQQQQ